MMKNNDVVLANEHEISDICEAEKIMIQSLEKSGKMYIPIKEIVRKIPQELRNRLDIKITAPVKKLRLKMEKVIGQKLKIFPGKRVTYIGKNVLPEELVALLIKHHQEISLGLLCQKLPLSKKQSISAVNTLIEKGVLLPRINEKMTIFLSIIDSSKADNKMILKLVEKKHLSPSMSGNEALQKEFKKAFQSVGKGRNFIRIHRIREYLNWPKDKFDQVLLSLMSSYTVEIHGGDPSSMTDKEIMDSYKDEKGRLFLTISWRKN